MKKIAVLGSFLEPSHHALIDSTAARCGFAADYFPDSRVPAELEQEMTRWEELSLRAEEQEN